MDILKTKEELLLGKTIYDMKLRVADYGRVSTDKDDQLNSLENQINYFGEMISSVEKWTHVGSYVDEGISGTSVKKRENFLRMIEDAKCGKIDLILTKEVSRFARNTIDSISYTEILLKYGVIVYFISDNINTIYPDSEFRLTLMASMAQDEVRKLSERVKFGIKRSIKDRKVGGGGLYGYAKNNGKLTIIDDEAKAVRMLYELYVTEEYGFKKIGSVLAENGYYTRKGKVFSDTTLKKMLNNPRYKGFYTANMSEVEDYKTHKKIFKPKSLWIVEKDMHGNIPAIVDEKLWDRCHVIYKKRSSVCNKNNLNKENYKKVHKFTGKLICSKDKNSFIRVANGKRKENPVWICNCYLRHGLALCDSPIILEKSLDEIFSSLTEDIIDKEKLLNEVVDDYINLIKEESTNLDKDNIKKKIDEQETHKKRLIDIFLKQMISDEEFTSKSLEIDKRILMLKNKLIELENNNLNYIYNNMETDIRKVIREKLNIKENIGEYFDLFIDKVWLSKINNNRKHIKLQIIFNYKASDVFLEIDYR